MTTDQAELIDALREYLLVREDVDLVSPDVGYAPNDAMRLLIRLNELFPEEGK